MTPFYQLSGLDSILGMWLILPDCHAEGHLSKHHEFDWLGIIQVRGQFGICENLGGNLYSNGLNRASGSQCLNCGRLLDFPAGFKL